MTEKNFRINVPGTFIRKFFVLPCIHKELPFYRKSAMINSTVYNKYVKFIYFRSDILMKPR